MFNRRKRSFRKGPPANQIYVPHDQRKLTQDPIPIMNEKQAQYYFQQLYDMGYIPTPVAPPPPQVIQVKMVQDSSYVTFKMNEQNKTIDISNINANDCNPYDIYGNLLDKTKYDLTNILNQNGYKLAPVICADNIMFHNHESSPRTLRYTLYSGTTATVTIPANSYFKVSDYFPSFTKAYPGMETIDAVYCFMYPYSDIDINTAPLYIYGVSGSFALGCKYLTCLVYPV